VTDNIIYQGAEAKICKSKFMGFDVIEKRRISKSYRIKEIDSQLISYRTREEVKLISEARKNGVSVPIIFDVDQEKGIITMEYLKGKRIKDIFNKIGEEERADICKKIGINVGRLHKNNLIHGDITTSNMIYQEGKIHFIDFGLGEINSEIEAKGVDLHVLMEAIESAHSKFSNFFKYVLDGYKSEYMQDAGSVIKKIDEIVKRGRYR
jgi:Kae1-associated kinase Bud32